MATRSIPLTQSRLKELLHYDPDTGVFTRRVATGRHGRWRAGTVAGCPDDLGYIMISLDYAKYFAHRLAWLYMTGEWPTLNPDHRDRDPANNRWENLRPATQSQNIQNASLRADNTSGIKGVHWSTARQKWVASITPPGEKLRSLGRFVTLEEAATAYRKAAENYFGEFANAARA